MIPRKIMALQAGFLLVLLIASSPSLILAEAAAEAAAGADAQADPLAQAAALPDADPSLMYGNGGVGVGRPTYGPPSPCEMTNQCCGMDKSNCCVGGQKCFNKLVRVCDGDGEQDCKVNVRQKCFDEKIKECRVIPEVVTRVFKATVCVPKPLRKCFQYTRKECTPSFTSAQKTITWENEKLVKTQDVPRNECTPINSYDCKEVTKRYNDTIQVPKTRVVPGSQRYCRLVPNKQPDQTVDIPQVYIKYEQRCSEMTVPSCSQSPCQLQGSCPPSQSVCSQTEFNTNTVCPFSAAASQNRPNLLPAGVAPPGYTSYPVGPKPGPSPGGVIAPGPGAGASCQQIRQPICSGAVGGACMSGAQQCCGTRKQRVCRQVPVRMTRTIQQTIPGQVRYEQECETRTLNRTETYYDTEIVSRNRTEKDCQPISKTECLNYTIPIFGVNSEKKSEQITVQLPECRQRIVTDEYCHTFPTGDFDCQPREVTKAFRINKIKCDQETTKPFCILVPSLNCRPGAPRCRMVPKQVCQKSCSQSAQCKQCDAFAQGSGFGTCTSSTCGNVYLPPYLSGTPGGSSIGGQGSYGGSIGGQGSFEGGSIGGQGSFEGGSIGGQGSYGGGYVVGGEGSYGGGSIGGQGSYGGAIIGGQGNYPGMIGGQGNYGGYTGGYGSYPGNSGYGQGGYPGNGYSAYPTVMSGVLPSDDILSGPNPGEVAAPVSLREEEDVTSLVEEEGPKKAEN